MRCVFDTNVVISTLLFNSSHSRSLRQAWQEQSLTPIVSEPTTRELLRVLQYPKFKLSPDAQLALAEEYLEYAETFTAITSIKEIYPCADPSDQKFLDLAHSSKADGIVSRDQDLLVMQAHFPISIFTMTDLAKFLKPKH